MNETPKTILEDDRPIKALFCPGENGPSYWANQGDNSKIVAYGEPGLHCDMPWLAVYDKAGNISNRIPATMVEIVYEKPEAT